MPFKDTLTISLVLLVTLVLLLLLRYRFAIDDGSGQVPFECEEGFADCTLEALGVVAFGRDRLTETHVASAPR